MASLHSTTLLAEISALPDSNATHAARLRFRRNALELAEREELIAPTFSFRLVDLDWPPAPLLRAEGEALYAPRLLPDAGQLTALACAVTTLGPRLEQRVTALFAEGSRSLALALDEIGNQLLLAVVRRVQDRMLAAARRRGLSMAGELRPGDPGLALDAQAAVLRLADGDAAGVSVHCGHALRPLKSVSMVLGVGIDLPPVRWSRCDDCHSRERCQVVRQTIQMAVA